jgi:hypothetical protein
MVIIKLDWPILKNSHQPIYQPLASCIFFSETVIFLETGCKNDNINIERLYLILIFNPIPFFQMYQTDGRLFTS